MIDSHILPSSDWGIRPVLFYIGKFPVESYSVFVLFALLTGIVVFYLNARKQKSDNERTFMIFFVALIGGILGAKLPVWIFNFKLIISSLPDLTPLLSGRTIVGGLIGGTLAVLLYKKYAGIKEKKGNIFAPAVAIAIAIGRLGCFLRGCCHGKPSDLPWAIDFGDGILRHPTQLYEAMFAFALFLYFQYRVGKEKVAGRSFKLLMIYYFSFRFLIEFIRVEEVIFLGLTGFQWASLGVLAYYLVPDLVKFINNRRHRL